MYQPEQTAGNTGNRCDSPKTYITYDVRQSMCSLIRSPAALRTLLGSSTTRVGGKIAFPPQVTGPGDSYSEEPPSVDAETSVISQNTVATMTVLIICPLPISLKQLLAVRAVKSHACCEQAKIKDALETQQVEISDTYGDGRHVSIDVVSPLFEGLSSVKRQRMVYKASSSPLSASSLIYAKEVCFI
jgi:stress-induced morphogen